MIQVTWSGGMAFSTVGREQRALKKSAAARRTMLAGAFSKIHETFLLDVYMMLLFDPSTRDFKKPLQGSCYLTVP
jgi:hypothetical protein